MLRHREEVMTRFPQVNPAPIRGAVPEVIRVPGALIRHLMGGTNSQELMNALRLICSFRKERTSMKIAAHMIGHVEFLVIFSRHQLELLLLEV